MKNSKEESPLNWATQTCPFTNAQNVSRQTTYTIKPYCEKCNSPAEFVRAISFVDAPGHEALMATMLSGAAIMDGAILVIAADEPCPQPQTREHLAAAEVSGIKNLIIVQNKIDIVDEKRALESYNEIKNFIKGTVAEKAPIIPNLSPTRHKHRRTAHRYRNNHSYAKKRRITKARSCTLSALLTLTNQEQPLMTLEGGIIGGTIAQGKFVVGEEIEIRPGISVEREGKTVYEPLISEIVSLARW